MTMMSETRFEELAEAFGGDIAKWPEDERGRAAERLAASPRLASVLVEARALDDLIREDGGLAVTATALRRALDVPERPDSPVSFLRLIWPFERIWPPAAGLVAASVLGIAVGLVDPTILDNADAATSVQWTYLADAAGSMDVE